MLLNEAAFKILKGATKYTQKGKTRRGRRISSSDCQLQEMKPYMQWLFHSIDLNTLACYKFHYSP
jgi:hypothetical protein